MTPDKDSTESCKEISDLNLCYMLLAQKLLREDRVRGALRLGISDEVADVLLGMSLPEIVRLATTNLVLCAFRLDDGPVVRMLRGDRKSALQQAHMAIVLSSARAQATGLNA